MLSADSSSMEKLNLNGVPALLCGKLEAGTGWDAASFSLLSAAGTAKSKRKSFPDVRSADFFTKLDFFVASEAAVNLTCLEAGKKERWYVYEYVY